MAKDAKVKDAKAQLVVVLGNPNPKKGSVRFDHVGTVEAAGVSADALQGLNLYVPRPFAEDARKVRMTLEVVE